VKGDAVDRASVLGAVVFGIGGLSLDALAGRLHESLANEGKEKGTFATNTRFSVHQQNRYSLNRILARLTNYVEAQCGYPHVISHSDAVERRAARRVYYGSTLVGRQH
jgi:hypothetical protein